MNSVLIALDAFSALYLIIILFALYFGNGREAKKTRFFRYTLWACLGGILSEIVACSLLLYNGPESLKAIFICLSYVFINILVAVYGVYLYVLIKEYYPTFKKNFTYFTLLLCVLNIAIIIAGSITSDLYTIANGEIVGLPLSRAILIIPTICYINMISLIVKIRKALSITRNILVLILVAVPALSIVIMYFYSNFGQGYPCAAISLDLIYIVIQSQFVTEANTKALLYNQMSVNDALTGLKNRRGYQEVIDHISPDDTVGVVFCDANSLKSVNDNFGHEAGDRLLQRIADLLKTSFFDGDICRISGDEFIYIEKNMNKNDFFTQAQSFGDLLKKNDCIASYGYATGTGDMILNVISAAEHEMYSDKERYYSETGRDRRR
ncbi:MAG: diguanylate cyclase [Lachnospiraceae bacterium]|nr:diguanylate cyclase [Lachnospiraceae bacterium]